MASDTAASPAVKPGLSAPMSDDMAASEVFPPAWPAPRQCPTTTPELHLLGEFPMTCYRCHVEADS